MSPTRQTGKIPASSLFEPSEFATESVETPETAPDMGGSPPRKPTPTATLPPPDDDDPFDPVRLRLSSDFASAAGVRKVLTVVPVTKPRSEWWVRTHPDPGYRVETGVVELKEEREVYLVDPSLWPDLSTEPMFGPRLLVTAINRQGVLFLWGLRLPGPDGAPNPWHVSALDAANRARSKWIRVAANMSLGAYDVWEAPAQQVEPGWPTMPFRDILQAAFRDRRISTPDHPIIRRLRGEA